MTISDKYLSTINCTCPQVTILWNTFWAVQQSTKTSLYYDNMAELTEAEHTKVTERRPLDNQNRHSNVQGWTLTVLKRRSHTLKKGHFFPSQNYKFDFRRKAGYERVKGDTDHSNKHIQQQSTKNIYWLQNAKKSDQEPYIQSNRSSRNHRTRSQMMILGHQKI